MQSTITAKGQATIPRLVRDHLHLKPGDKVRFFIQPDGRVALLPARPVSVLRGIVRSTRAVTLEEMEEAIAEGAANGE